MKKISFLLALVVSIFLVAGCGSEEVEVSKKAELLMSKQWKLQVNETIEDFTDEVEDGTGITADIKLEGDVGAIADFLAETLSFTRDNNDPMKLAYSSKIGEGIFSLEVLGWWEMSEDDKELTMKEWDSSTKTTREPVVY